MYEVSRPLRKQIFDMGPSVRLGRGNSISHATGHEYRKYLILLNNALISPEAVSWRDSHVDTNYPERRNKGDNSYLQGFGRVEAMPSRDPVFSDSSWTRSVI